MNYKFKNEREKLWRYAIQNSYAKRMENSLKSEFNELYNNKKIKRITSTSKLETIKYTKKSLISNELTKLNYIYMNLNKKNT
jgi:hypothetical protein